MYNFYFWIKKSYNTNSKKKTSSVSEEDGTNFSMSRFGCYFRRS